jgi:hypothetical protein
MRDQNKRVFRAKTAGRELLSANKKAAGQASGGMIKSSGNRERGQTATSINGPFR